MCPYLNKITNLLSFNFICCDEYLFTGKNLTNNPTYIFEKWNRHCRFTPDREYKCSQNPQFLQLRESYHKVWDCNDDIDRYLEYFWSIQKIRNIEGIVDRFEYYFGSVNNITSIISGGIHPNLKRGVDELIDSMNLDVVLRDIKLNSLIF